MADLLKQAEEEARDVSEVRRQISELKRELAEARKGRAPIVDQDAIDRAVRAALVEELQRFDGFRTEADKRFSRDHLDHYCIRRHAVPRARIPPPAPVPGCKLTIR
jgi:hypothetical protein